MSTTGETRLVWQDKDNPLIWYAKSDTYGQPPYTMDLGNFNANGECPCPDCQIARRKRLREGFGPDDTTRCKHLKRARSAFVDKIILEYIQSRRATKPNKNQRPN